MSQMEDKKVRDQIGPSTAKFTGRERTATGDAAEATQPPGSNGRRADSLNTSRSEVEALKPGDKVIIRQNPHHPGAEGIVGTVLVFRLREGFGESDLVDVHYKHPKSGKGYTMPFGLSCLGSADPASLLALAEHHERIAAKLRAIAKTSDPTA